jgi:O-antigen ligase
MAYLILIFCILFFILSFKRLDWAVMVLIAALPAYLIRFKIFGVPFTLLEAMILISFIVWFLKNYKKIINSIKLKIRHSTFGIRHSQRYPFDIEIVLLLIISFAAVFTAGLTDSALGIWKAYFFEPALLFIVILNISGSGNTKKSPQPPFIKGGDKILWPLAISALAVSVFAIYQKFTGAFIFNEFWAASETRRVTSFFGYPNAVGLYLGPIVMVLIGFLLSQIKYAKSQIFNFQLPIFKQFSITNFQIFKIAIIFLAIIGAIISIYFAKSEGALIGVAAGLLVFGFLSNRKAKWATVGLVVLAVVGIMAYAPAREYSIKKIALKDLSGEIRKAQWRETWEMLTDGRLFTGAGLANYQKAVKPYHQEGIFFNKDNDPDFRRKIVLFDERYKSKYWQPLEIYLYPHNIFLNFWTELGLVGMLLFIWIIGKYFIIGFKIIRNSQFDIRHSAVQSNKYVALGLICSMLVIVIHGMVDVPYFKNDLAAMFWIFIAALSLLKLPCKRG